MAKKEKAPVVWAVRTPEALQALERWLRTLDPGTYVKGEDSFANGGVTDVQACADHYVEAGVEGTSLYAVTLFLTRGKWSSTCTCRKKKDCEHAIAAGLMWICSMGEDYFEEDEDDFDDADDFPPRPRFVDLAPPPKAASAGKRRAFAEQWAPVIADKLGRKLTAAEVRRLDQLAELFREFTNTFNTVTEHALRQHGFEEAIPPGANAWNRVFEGWWSYHAAPADPWELWQYLAYSLQLRGLPIPEVFQPKTNTARVHASLEAHFLHEHTQVWRNELAEDRAAASAALDNPLRESAGGLRACFEASGSLFVEVRETPEAPWKRPGQRWLNQLSKAHPPDFGALDPAAAALAMTLALCHRLSWRSTSKQCLTLEATESVITCHAARPAILLPDGQPFAIEPEALTAEAVPSSTMAGRLEVRLARPDGVPALGAKSIALRPAPLYFHAGRIWRGPPPLPPTPLPVAALRDSTLLTKLRERGVRLPDTLEAKVERIALVPRLKCWLQEPPRDAQGGTTLFCAQLFAQAKKPRCTQVWQGLGGWQWDRHSIPPARRPQDPLFEFDLTAANAVGAHFADFRLSWSEALDAWTRPVSKNFPDEFLAWHAALPPGIEVDSKRDLAAFFDPPLQARVDFSASATDSNHDWFDLTVALRVEDTKLTDEEVALLLKAEGRWVRLPRKGWQRLQLTGATSDESLAATLDRLGLTATDVIESGRAATHRLHALQLAGEADSLEARDATLAAALRHRVADLATRAPPPLPAGLTATLRPYQVEGFHFLTHLSTQSFGGVLADDMGLGKTVQTLAWLLHLAAAQPADKRLRVLVVCPKSVTHGWLAEIARFAPSLSVVAFTPELTAREVASLDVALLVVNYTQLRLNADWFKSAPWDVVVLDEGQFIKNPTSQIAAAVRALPARHRLVLTGTPIENRLTDLWSLFAFAQPGLLGGQTSFRRQYDEKDPAALVRLHRRVRHFLLRRTKAEAAPDLPPRTEDEIVVELEPEQRKLYEAELKHARAQLLGIETARALDQVRFNILASLLRLRQICCHPALVDPAHANLPSAKLDALLERLEELADEGHQVLVFSQFVGMLELIRTRLATAGLGHLMLTGATENRAELVEEFQRDRTKTVFLLSLKAAGFGLNLTAASYAILYDPWWNPAVEAQAIDRTHRIGQTRPVIAYRLLADNTVEQKIRALQQEKAALAAAVVQEDSLANVLDLESLRRILA